VANGSNHSFVCYTSCSILILLLMHNKFSEFCLGFSFSDLLFLCKIRRVINAKFFHYLETTVSEIYFNCGHIHAIFCCRKHFNVEFWNCLEIMNRKLYGMDGSGFILQELSRRNIHKQRLSPVGINGNGLRFESKDG